MSEPTENGENGVRDSSGKFINGNPGGPGRHKKTDYQKAYEELLYELVAEQDKPIIKKLIERAKAGDIGAIKEINDRILGRARLPVDLGGNPVLPFTLIIKKDGDTGASG